ncbi:unnamed protein product, partial [Didymodactylos carnosus]
IWSWCAKLIIDLVLFIMPHITSINDLPSTTLNHLKDIFRSLILLARQNIHFLKSFQDELYSKAIANRVDLIHEYLKEVLQKLIDSNDDIDLLLMHDTPVATIDKQ